MIRFMFNSIGLYEEQQLLLEDQSKTKENIFKINRRSYEI